ncbi:DNA cytosine methyltransferase, partial [Cribrihabitans sp. XS_ASV171]
CAPCQPFSSYKQRYEEDPQWALVPRFGEIAAECRPDYVSMENVPRLLEYKDGAIFETFKSLLEAEGYGVWYSVVNAADYGVPQSRRRLVLVAAKNGGLAPPETWTSSAVTVKEAIGHLPPLAAGEISDTDPLHRSSSLSEKNVQRIRASRPGGSWKDWPDELVAACHKKSTGRTYPSVYGRMSWDTPSPTITTQSYGFGNGRFGHPEQDRAISLREAAILQSFPEDYKFLPPDRKISMKEVGRWIGNAVPVKLAESIAKGIKLHKEFSDDGREPSICDEHRSECHQASGNRPLQ